MGRFLATRAGDREIAELAARQHGVVSLTQLRGLGLSADAARKRAGQGRLHRVHRGVYAVGHRRLTERGHMWAAVLAVPGGALSHWSAAALWELARLPTGALHVTTAGGSRSTRAITVHRRRAETTNRDGLRVTTVVETLRDLATTTSRHRLERLLARAEHLRLLDTAALAEQFDRRGGRRLEAALGTAADAEPTRSELEEQLLEELRRAGLPRPQVNTTVEGFEVDFVWRAQRLIAETDGAQTHLTRRAFEEDRRRDQVLVAAGWRVVRFTYAQVQRGTAVAALRALL